MKTTAYTIRELSRNVYEIGEFDCGSMFLIIGREQALLIDAGIGIGNIRAAIAELTDKPVTLALTHSHLDHIGNAPVFGSAYAPVADIAAILFGEGTALERRRQYAEFIAQRSGLAYDYDLDRDMEEWNGAKLSLIPLTDGHTFDLGDRIVTAYDCPGHTKGSMVFLDDKSRILFLGDALNCNLLLGMSGVSIEKSLKYLERLQLMSHLYDRYYNGHYDYRLCGEALDACVLPDAIAACQALVSGDYQLTMVPSPLPIFPDREMMVTGKAMIAFDPENILEPKA